MAMYGGDIGGYMTPDGRTVQLPAGLAAQYPALRPVLPPPPGSPPPPPPAPDGNPGQSTAPPPPMTPIPLPGGGSPQWTASDAADLAKATDAAKAAQSSGSTLTGPVATPVPAGRVPARGGKAPAAAQPPDTGAAPQGQRPLTNADFAKMGIAGPANAAIAAGEEKKAAISQRSDALVDEAKQVGDAQAAAAQDAQTRLEAEAAEAQRRQAGLDQHTQDLQTQAQKIANTKIDHTADHPWIAAIGVALATLGTAMQNRDAALAAAFAGRPAPAPIENPGLKAMYAAIDRKVAEQMQALDIQKTAFGASTQAVEAERSAMQSRLTQMATLRIGYLEQAKMKIEAIKTQAQGPEVKANAALAQADVSREQAETLGAEQGRWQAHDDMVQARKQAAAQHAESIGLQRAQMNQQYLMHRETLAVQQQDKMAEISAQLLKEGKAEAAAKAKAVAEGGLFDPRSRDPLMNPAGREKFQQADKLEAAARQQQDPALAEKQRAQAQDLRLSARINDAIVLDPKIAGALRPSIQTAQEVTNQISDLTKKLESDPSAFNREQWSGIATQMANLSNIYQKTIGERVSPRAFDQTMKHILEFDPDSYFHREVNQKRAIESLRTLKDIVANNIDSALGAEGVKTDWKPRALDEGEDVTRLDNSEKTAAEVADERSKGYLDLSRYTGGQEQAKEEAHSGAALQLGNAAAGQADAEAGLSPNAVTHLRALAARAGTAGDAQHNEIVKSLSNSIADGLKDDSRVSHSLGVVDVLRSSDEGLYREVVGALPELARDRVLRLEAARRPVTSVPRARSKYSEEAADRAAAADEAQRRAAAFAPYQAGAPLAGSPGAGTPR